ncbi:MAG: coproporphyrinogen III oxidase [Moorea sp. SIO2I5]|nr:coproporphyrinogen III oxidase [Moorena sp. SIO2I5]
MVNLLHNSEKDCDSLRVSAAYVHIPFCRRRCYYCDFAVSVVGDNATQGTSSMIDQYVEVLSQEINITPPTTSSLDTVFFGGGTPSLLTVEQLAKILDTLDRRFGIAADAEISMEMDPGTFTKDQLTGYRDLGVNRVSLGVQAFQDKLLSNCGRTHDSKDIVTAIELIDQVEVPEFSLDLISGLPDQTLEQWQECLEITVKIAPTHISSYDLVLEPVTAFGRQYTSGTKPLPTDETTAVMYRLAQQLFTSVGYEHYEISNYALPGHQCRHNRVYWENRPYYGFGMGAASYTQGYRFTRPRTRREYYAWVEQLVQAGGVSDGSPTNSEDVLLETLMLGLRLAEGLSLSMLAERFGENILEQIWTALLQYYGCNWVEVVGDNGERVNLSEGQRLPVAGRLRLTDPDGFLFSNTILADLFHLLG